MAREFGRIIKLAKSDTLLLGDEEMKLRLWFGIFALLVSACGPTQQWVKPGATEADLQAAMTLCNRENVHFGRNNIRTIGPDG